ncbi:helix-turn-helix domain-containing protein [Nitritalea halalkaliphila]|uniref:helix-turn-helix domain-containing protein n=1 Tax=Nitritalea halalkaliphila TaxID=590849 RepID=UPI00373FDC7C
MKKDMHELKKLVLETYQSGGLNASIINKHQRLFEGVETEEGMEREEHQEVSRSSEREETVSYPILLEHRQQQEHEGETEEYEDTVIEDIAHEEDEGSLSLEKKERELIIRALKKHHNKRKYAALDLGISERTLYRKIKQYDIEG